MKHCMKRHIASIKKIASAVNFHLYIHQILSNNTINNLASTSRQLESRSLGVELAEAYLEPCQISKYLR